MLIHLSTPITVAIDIAAWFIIHMGVSYFITKIPRSSFNKDSFICKQRHCEHNGSIYFRFLRINLWKKLLPDGAALFKEGFEKKKLKEFNKEYFSDFLQETCRAEITHWIVLLSGFLFFIWNLWWVGIVMVVYAIAANAPCIITQRYNRIRLRRVLNCFRTR
jgi:glycosyl-4,4'-diaponeurosporenoate acyltransferase